VNPRRLWRRSLGLRVVGTTLLTSLIVVGVLGVVLLHQVGRGLLDAQRRSALSDLDAGLASARLRLQELPDVRRVDDDRDVYSVASALSLARGGTPVFDIAVIPATGSRSSYATRLLPEDIPSALRAVVGSGAQAYTYVTLSTGARALLAGGTVTGRSGELEVYYAFPLRAQEQSMSLVRARLISGAAVLMGLLAIIAALVTRQVVRPVRRAAAVADRIATGLLSERVEVHGEDDLARLATAFNEMTAAMQAQIGRLEDMSRSQRRFTADVSHELRTPLTTVRMAADVLHGARGAYPPEVARAAELLHHELERFETLLADLLEISRHDAQAAELEVEPVDLVALVRHELDAVAVLAATRGVTLHDSRIDPGPVVAEVDGRRVSRILRNLLTNAIEYGEGQPVHVDLHADDDAVAVRVRDHGPGLTSGQTSRVFDRFWRADSSRARSTGGTGLGLSIAMEDTRLHGGWLQASSQPGQGSTFRLVLPRHSGGVLEHSPLPLSDAEVLS
jgi:two-component system sensor histidine kinase MtrB